MNLVIIAGTLSQDPVVRTLPSGATLVSMDVSTCVDGTRANVPVAWFDPRLVPPLAAGDQVMAWGQVRRRFFRAAGSTQSRTEVVAHDVIPMRRRRSVDAALRRALATIDAVSSSDA